MKVNVKKKVWKEVELLPKRIQQMVSAQIKNLKSAKSLNELENVIRLKGTNEPYYRLSFNDYRIIFYFDETTDTVDVRRLKHRQGVYKKHNLPWN